jgi:sigma-B regulation protein RsbU (phosphoserine phosphatase)
MYMHNTELNTKLAEFTNHLEDVVALRTKELSEANYVLSKGLETVAHVQKNFLPPKNKAFRGWDLAISYNALDNNVSGDLYDYYFADGVLDGIGIFDVSGHGIPAGLMTILAKSIISQHFITGMNQDESISNVLKDINKSYIKEKVDVENYITGLLFRFSEFNKKDICSVEFANAGHPYPLLYKADENKIIELKQEDQKQYGILGVEGLDVSFPPVSFRIAQDDIIICYTDGLTDSVNSKGEEFSKERVLKIIKEYHHESAIMLMNRIMDKLNDFIGREKPTDDITLMVLKRTNSKDYIEEI